MQMHWRRIKSLLTGVRQAVAPGLTVLAAAVLGAATPAGAQDQDQVLDSLKVGGVTYSNVTVFNKTRTDVFIKCAGGVANLKVRDIDLDTLELLGYQVERPKPKMQFVVAEKIQANPQFQAMQAMVAQQVTQNLQRLDQRALIIAGSLLLLLYAFFCYCCMLICQKSGIDPGGMVWLPVLQMFPLLRAAKMPAWWFLWFLLPVFNFVASLVWCVKIAKARHKSVLTAIMLMLPVTSFVAFLYLAFSGGGVEEEVKPISLSY